MGVPLRLKTIANFLTPEDAEVARIALADEGIPASLENATTVGMLWYYGNAVGWVKLQVPEADEQRSREVLSRKMASSDAELPAIICPKCGSHLPRNFEICWLCGATIGDALENRTASLTDTTSDIEGEAEETSPGDDAAWRALRAAVLGTFILPPLLTFYSGWLILRLAIGDKRLSKRGKMHFYCAMVVDLAVCFVVGCFLASI